MRARARARAFVRAAQCSGVGCGCVYTGQNVKFLFLTPLYSLRHPLLLAESLSFSPFSLARILYPSLFFTRIAPSFSLCWISLVSPPFLPSPVSLPPSLSTFSFYVFSQYPILVLLVPPLLFPHPLLLAESLSFSHYLISFLLLLPSLLTLSCSPSRSTDSP